MSFVAISDVHIKDLNDKAHNLFNSFLDHELTKSADTIYLLGDIFDLLVGGYEEYLEKYYPVFKKISELANSGKTIRQIEGNHDFHFDRLIAHARREFGVKEESWTYHLEPFVEEYGKQKILFAHGDEIELENIPYQRYRKIIRSKFFYFLTNDFFPYRIVNSLGTGASQKSRNRNIERYGHDNNEKVKESFRRAFKKAGESYDFDLLVCGHSHCQDLFGDGGKTYSNNGFFPKTKAFTYFADESLNHMTLE